MKHSLFIFVLLMLVSMVNAQGNILARYSFDDGTANDGSGNGHNGVMMGDPQSIESILANALEFDGMDDYIMIPEAQQLAPDTVNISFWFYLNEPANSDMMLIHKRNNDEGYSLWIDGETNQFIFGLYGQGGALTMVRTPFPAQPRIWTSVFVTYDTQTIRVYLHGQLVVSETQMGVDLTESTPIYLASDGEGAFFQGAMDNTFFGTGPATSAMACGSALKLWHQPSEQCLGSLLDVTEELGLGDVGNRHFGIATVDFDQDGWIDIYYPNGAGDPVSEKPESGECPTEDIIIDPAPANYNTFFINNGDGTFTENVAPEMGLDDWWNAMRHVWGDLDNDGVREIISHNFIKSPIYKAVSTDPWLFEEVNEEIGAVICITRGTGASFADFNNDGWLDIYAAEYDASRLAKEHVNYMFMNNGDGTFTDVTSQAAVNLPDNAMGTAAADYDNDGDQDLFLTNSHEAPTRLYKNLGHDHITGIPIFINAEVEAGVAVDGDAGRGFGGAFGDYNNDGNLDILYTREGDSRLFLNNGPNGDGNYTFTDMTGVGGMELQNAMPYQDGNFADINNDGWLDVLVCNADVTAPNLVYLNNADGTWTEVAQFLGMDNPTAEQQGVSPADIDNDGDLDVVWYSHNLGHKNYVFRNENRGNNWVQFRLTGTASNRDAVGARIYVTAELWPGEEPVTQMREIFGGTGFFTDMPRIQTFGLGKASEIISAKIVWPASETEEEFTDLEINMRHDFVEPGVINSVDYERPTPIKVYSLGENYPNPFNPNTTIRYTIRGTEPVSIKIYNMLGQEVATVVDGVRAAGEHFAEWNGLDGEGKAVASGVYIYRMKAGQFTASRKMLLTK